MTPRLRRRTFILGLLGGGVAAALARTRGASTPAATAPKPIARAAPPTMISQPPREISSQAYSHTFTDEENRRAQEYWTEERKAAARPRLAPNFSSAVPAPRPGPTTGATPTGTPRAATPSPVPGR